MQRLCGIERILCQTTLDSLVTAKFLCLKPDGHYARLTDSEIVLRVPVTVLETSRMPQVAHVKTDETGATLAEPLKGDQKS